MSDEKESMMATANERIRELLAAFDARKLTETKAANGRLHWYLAKGQIFLIQEYAKCGGVEVFAALTRSNSTDDLIEAMRKRLVEG